MIALALAVAAIACPLCSSYSFVPAPEIRDGAMTWLVLMVASLFGSMLASIADALAKPMYEASPDPKPLVGWFELGVTVAPSTMLPVTIVPCLLLHG